MVLIVSSDFDMKNKKVKKNMDTNSNAIHDEKSVNASSSGTGSGEPLKESRQDAAAEKQVQDQKAADEAPAVENEAGSGAVECSNAEAEACKKELEKLTKEIEESKDKYLRLVAEFDNFRRRTSKERLDLVQTAGEDIIKGLLPVLDDCERAMKALAESVDSEAAKEGTNLIYSKLLKYLKSRGVESIKAIGENLDTDFHEAVAKFPVEDKEKKGKVIDVVEQGYTLNGKVIRFAKVVVGD